MRQLLGLGAPGDSLDRAGSPEVSQRPILSITKQRPAHVAEVVAEGVARVGRSAPVPENVRFAVKLHTEMANVGIERGEGAVAERAADRRPRLG